MKVLVTGGAGFIGNGLVKRLLAEGYEVTSFDRTKYSGLREGVNEVYGDVQDSYSVDCYVAEHDYVFNIAGMLGTAETVDNPIPACNINIIGALNVFNSARRNKVGCTHITVGNYWMNNPYSITKSTSERFALMYNKEHKAKISIVRGLNVYGPGQKAYPVRKLMPNLILPALKGEDILIYGTGEQRMDMIYIDDAVDVLYRTMTVDHGIYDSIFDAGMGVAPSVNKIAQEVIDVTNSDSKLVHQGMRPGEDEISVVVGDAKTLKPLGYSLRTMYTSDNQAFEVPDKFISLEEGIKLTVPYYEHKLKEAT